MDDVHTYVCTCTYMYTNQQCLHVVVAVGSRLLLQLCCHVVLLLLEEFMLLLLLQALGRVVVVVFVVAGSRSGWEDKDNLCFRRL